jgi:hypothetical protein
MLLGYDNGMQKYNYCIEVSLCVCVCVCVCVFGLPVCVCVCVCTLCAFLAFIGNATYG